MVDKYIVDGKVAVLVSPGYGAGWYTWHRDERMLYDPNIVKILLESPPIDDPDLNVDRMFEVGNKIESYCKEAYPGVYVGGAVGLYVEWVPVGEQFRISEYDGSETLIRASAQIWITA